MARTVLTVTAPAESTATTPTATTIDATNSHYIPATAKAGECVIVALNTFAGSKALTVKAGDNPPAVAAGQGDLTITIAQDAYACAVLDTSRFLQDDGTINIDVAASMTGSIWVIQMPQGH